MRYMLWLLLFSVKMLATDFWFLAGIMVFEVLKKSVFNSWCMFCIVYICIYIVYIYINIYIYIYIYIYMKKSQVWFAYLRTCVPF